MMKLRRVSEGVYECEFCAEINRAIDAGLSASDFIRICELSARADFYSHSCTAEKARESLDEALELIA